MNMSESENNFAAFQQIASKIILREVIVVSKTTHNIGGSNVLLLMLRYVVKVNERKGAQLRQ